MTQTENYQLSQWAASDRIMRTDFNSDNEKLDTAIKAVADAVSTKAETSALNALSAAMPHIAVGSYVGNGSYGAGSPCTLTFSFTPKALILFNGDANGGMKAPMLLISPDTKQFFVQDGAGGYNIRVTWSGNKVSWYSTNNEKVQFNTTYGKNYYIALG